MASILDFLMQRQKPMGTQLTPGYLPQASNPEATDPSTGEWEGSDMDLYLKALQTNPNANPDPFGPASIAPSPPHPMGMTGREKGLTALTTLAGLLSGISRERSGSRYKTRYDIGQGFGGGVQGLLAGLDRTKARKLQDREQYMEENPPLKPEPAPRPIVQKAPAEPSRVPVKVGTHLYDPATGEDLGLAPDLMAGQAPPRTPGQPRPKAAPTPKPPPSDVGPKNLQSSQKEIRSLEDKIGRLRTSLATARGTKGKKKRVEIQKEIDRNLGLLDEKKRLMGAMQVPMWSREQADTTSATQPSGGGYVPLFESP